MLSITWSTYRNTFERQSQGSGYLQELVTKSERPVVQLDEVDFETQEAGEVSNMDASAMTERTSSASTLVPEDEKASLSKATEMDFGDFKRDLLSGVLLSTLSPVELDSLAFLVAQEKERREEVKRRYNNTPLRRILARQLSKEVSVIYSLEGHASPEVESTISETKTVDPAKRYNNTPLRRILARQMGDNDTLPREGEKHAGTSPQEAVLISEPLDTVARYSNTPLRRILSRQMGREFTALMKPSTLEPKDEPPSLVDAVTPKDHPPVRYNNTPIRRIIARQLSGEVKVTPVLEKIREVHSPVDSVVSEGDAMELVRSTTSLRLRLERMEEWANAIAINDERYGFETLKRGNVAIKRSNTPLSRLLERQVAATLVER